LLLLPGCGGDDSKGKPIPAAQSESLIKNIQAADQYSADGSCGRAHTKVRDAKFVLSQVPDNVDPDVRKGISDGLDHLNSLIDGECERPQTQTDTTPTQTQTTVTETQTTPTETTPTQTQTTPTETTLTGTTPTETTPTTPTTTGNGGTPPGAANGAAGGTG
jgi:hypothetical protein